MYVHISLQSLIPFNNYMYMYYAAMSHTLYLFYHLLDLSWQVTLGEYEGGGTHPLLSTPSNKPVTTTDVYEYVQKYSELRMLKVVEEPLRVSYAVKPAIVDIRPPL